MNHSSHPLSRDFKLRPSGCRTNRLNNALISAIWFLNALSLLCMWWLYKDLPLRDINKGSSLHNGVSRGLLFSLYPFNVSRWIRLEEVFSLREADSSWPNSLVLATHLMCVLSKCYCQKNKTFSLPIFSQKTTLSAIWFILNTKPSVL